MHPKDQKEALRESIAERMKRMSDQDRAAESRSLCRRLLPSLPEGSLVCGYMPMKSEVDIAPLLRDLLARGDRVFLPRFEGTLVYREVKDLDHLVPGQLKVLEPAESAPVLDADATPIVLVPARAYTRKGERMGRGNGGYDIWIRKQRAAKPATRFIGVCYECQLLNEVPMEAHDEIVDAVCTARGLIECKK